MKNVLAVLAIALILTPTVSATCLTADDMLLLVGLESKLNMTPGSLIAVFDHTCPNETTAYAGYPDEIIDAKLSVLAGHFENNLTALRQDVNDGISGVDGVVSNRMQEYTDYFEDTYGYTPLLSAIYNNTLTLASQNVTVPEINDSLYVRKSDLEDFDFEQMEIDINNLQNGQGYTGMTAGYSQPVDYTLVTWTIIGIIILVVLNYMGILKRFGVTLPKVNAPIPRPQMPVPQRDPYGTPEYSPERQPTTAQDARTQTRRARDNRLKETFKNTRENALKADMERTSDITDPVKRAIEEARIQKEIDKLSQEA